MRKRDKTPKWAADDKQLVMRCVDMRKFKIAQMFWQQGMSVLDIATTLDTTYKTVECVIARMRKQA